MRNLKMELELNIEEINKILSGLGKLPYEQVFELVNKIQTQVQPQLDKQKKND